MFGIRRIFRRVHSRGARLVKNYANRAFNHRDCHETIYSTTKTEENWIIHVGNKTGNDCSRQVNLQILYIHEYPAIDPYQY